MDSEKYTSKKHSSKKKIVISFLAAVCLVVLIIFFAIPIYLSSSSGNNMILGKINNAVNGRVDIEKISISWLKGLKAKKLNFTDSAGATKISAQSIEAMPKYLALLGGSVQLDKAVIEKPVVDITIDKTKAADKKTEAKKTLAEQSPSATASGVVLPVKRMNLKINQGNIRINTVAVDGSINTLEMANLNSTVALRPLGSRTSFDVAVDINSINSANDVNGTGISHVAVAGDLKTSKNKWSLKKASGNLNVKITDLELATLAPLFAIADVNITMAGKVKADLQAKLNDGLLEDLQADVSADALDIRGDFLKGDELQTKNLQIDVKLATTENQIKIDSLKVKTDALSASAKGAVPMTLDSIEKFLQADSPDMLDAEFDCDLAKTLYQVKTIAGFKPDFDIKYGRLTGNISTQAKDGKRIVAAQTKLWALEGTFPIKKIVLSKPVELDTEIVSDKQKITVEKCDLDSAFIKASLNGTTDNMNYTTEVDLAKMQSDVGQFIEIKPALSGTASLVGKAACKDRIFASTGKAKLSNVVITMPDGQNITQTSANAAYDLKADADKKILNVNSAALNFDAGKVNITDFAMPFGENRSAAVKFNTTAEVKLEKLMPILRALGGIDSKANFAGLVKGDFAMAKTGSVIAASTKQTTLSNLKITYPDKQPFTQDKITVGFNGKFDIEKKIYDITRLNVESEQINISGNVSNAQKGSQITTKGNIKADYDLVAVSSIISPFMPSGLSATGKRNDSLQFSSTYPENEAGAFMANLSAKTSFGFDEAEYMGLSIGKTELDVNIDNGNMVIVPFSSVINDSGKLNFAGSCHFNETPAIFKTSGEMKMLDSVSIDTKTTDVLLTYVNPIFANAADVTGVLNFNCEKCNIPLQSGYQNAIALTGTLSITNMKLGSPLITQIAQLTGSSSEPVITVLPTRFVLANSILSYENMQVNIGSKAVNFAGQIKLDKTMNMKVTLPWKHNGQRITVPVNGSVDSPQVDLGGLLEDQLKQEIENQIKKGLESLFN